MAPNIGVPLSGETPAEGETSTSTTDVCNDALGQIGAARISSFESDPSVPAVHCRTFYPPLRDGLLRSAHWNFAMARQTLTVEATAPPFEYSYQYPLPSDLLKVVEYYGATPVTPGQTWTWTQERTVAKYKLEGRKLLTNDSAVKILYLRRVTNPAEWDALFYQLLTTWLASKLAMAITKDAGKSQTLLTQAIDLLLPMALAVDGQEGSVEPFLVDTLIWGR